jgi:DNA-binding NtrC family response regulator
MAPGRIALVGLRASGFRDLMERWLSDAGYATRVTDVARVAVEWARVGASVSFVETDLGSLDGEQVWRVVRRTCGGHRLVLMAERRTKDLWFEALAAGVGSLLPLPTEREVVLTALRSAGPPG